MQHKVVLCVEGIDLDDDETLDIIGLHLNDLVWSSVGNDVRVAVLTSSADPVAAVVTVARDIECRLVGARVTRVDEQFVTTREIADAVGLTREAVRLWVRGHRRSESPFPRPRAHLAVSSSGNTTKVWAWADVVSWMRESYDVDPEPGILYLGDRDVAALNMQFASTRSGTWTAVADAAYERCLQRVDDAIGVGSARGARYTLAG